VSGAKRGWNLHPDSKDVRAKGLPPIKPSRVVGIGATCDLGPERSADSTSLNFSVTEFVTLDDGQRVILHEGRGFTVGLRSTGKSDRGDLREHETLESLTRDVLNTVLPDDDEPAEDHPWTWLAGLARARGVNVSADDLRGLRYEVTFTDRVHRWLEVA